MIRPNYFLKILFTSIFLFILMGISLYPQTVVDPTLTLNAPGIVDQDDMCIWVHHNNKSLSTIISSDKVANKLFVYDLSGNVLQTINIIGQPGNIDIRYNFMISGVPTDIVGYNNRTNGTIVFYKVDRTTRQLSFVSNFSDGGMTGNNYGFCLYRNLITAKYYAIASSNSTQIKQWELVDNGDGTIGDSLKRTWNNGSGSITEGLVADDELGIIYAANEGEGIYKYNADPNDPNPVGELIAPIGVNGLTADVEGITIYYTSQGRGYLIASSQGSSDFKVYERQAPHNFVKTVQVNRAGRTDGIDVTNLSLGPSFPLGLFLVHDGTGSPKVIRGCKWEDLGLEIDITYWDPTNIPDSPTNLAATAVGQTQIDLSWTDNSSNEDVFRIEKKPGLGGVYTEIATVAVNVTSYQDTGLTANTEHCYRVRAYNTGGNSEYSNEDCATTNPTIPASPGNLTALATGVNEVTLSWTDNSDNEDGFIIERENITLPGFSVIDSVVVNDTSYIDSTVNQGVSYNYRISAYNISGQSGHSNVYYVTTILPAPTNLVSSLFGGPPYSVVLNWQESSINELGFVIERDTVGLGSFETLDSVAANVTFCEDTKFVNPVDTFYYRIYAFSQDTVSEYGNIAEMVIPVELTSFTALTSKGRVTLNWTTATEINNLGFEIERKIINSVNQGEWVRIGFKEGHGTTTEIQNYQFIDEISDIQATSLSYRLKQIDYDGSYEYSVVVEVKNLAPTDYALHQNFPNPFNPVTTISYSLSVKAQVTLVVYNTLGEKVKQLVNEEKEAGRYEVKFNSHSGEFRNLPSGIYFYRLQSGSFVDTKKMILLK